MTALDHDVVVIGAGLAGAAAAWQLSERGLDVLVLEAYTPGHLHGSSHGTSRIYRRAYADPFYVALTGEAEVWWDRLEGQSGETLRVRTGELDTGDGRDLRAMASLLGDQGVSHELLSPEAVAERWPGLTVAGTALFHDAAGYLDPTATMAACLRLAVGSGAEVRFETPVRSIRRLGTDGVRVETETGTHTAATAVVAVGGWLPELWASLDLDVPVPPLTVRQQEVFHFRPAAGGPVAFPTIVHKQDVPAPLQLYAVASGADGGPEPAFKVARFDSSTITTASSRDYVVHPGERALITDWVAARLPGLVPEPVAEQSCLFTLTPDEDFLLDRRGPVIIASPCSGHGAKFAPLTGAMIADLVQGRPARPRFALKQATL